MKRFRPAGIDGSTENLISMVESPDGQWVRLADAEALEVVVAAACSYLAWEDREAFRALTKAVNDFDKSQEVSCSADSSSAGSSDSPTRG